MTPEPIARCSCGAWTYTGSKCGACYAFQTREDAIESAMKRMIANMLRDNARKADSA